MAIVRCQRPSGRVCIYISLVVFSGFLGGALLWDGMEVPSYGLSGTPFKTASQVRRLSSLTGSRSRRTSLGDFLYSFSSWIRRLVVDAEGAVDGPDEDAQGDEDGIAMMRYVYISSLQVELAAV